MQLNRSQSGNREIYIKIEERRSEDRFQRRGILEMVLGLNEFGCVALAGDNCFAAIV